MDWQPQDSTPIIKSFISDYSIDDIHQAALGEFDNDPAAIRRLNAAYVEAQNHYIFVLMELRAAKANQQ
jgi:hypothetical protein